MKLKKVLLNNEGKVQFAIWFAIGLLIIATLIGGYILSQQFSSGLKASTVTVQDSAGRYVEVSYPVQKIVVLWDNPVEEIRALGAIDRIAGIDTQTKSKVDEGFYPELVDVPVVGSWDEPNYEEIAQLKPDVVIMLSSWGPSPDEVQNHLKPFGIAVVALDFYRVEVWEREIKTLGFMLGLDEKADEYINFFKEKWDLVKERVKDIPDEERKKVYFEGADEYITYGGGDYGCGIPGIIRAAGGIDLFPEIFAYYFEVDPEEVAKRNPDVIVKGTPGGYFLNNSSQFETLWREIMNRPELANTKAVKNGEVYVISWDVAGGARKKFGPIFLAKMLYPDKFVDLDPYAFLQEYLEKYQGMPYQGIYVYPPLS